MSTFSSDQQSLHRDRISVVIPVWDDWAAVQDLVCGLGARAAEVEWIAAAVAPTIEETALAQRLGITLVRCPLPNRGYQLNMGGYAAHGRVLLFQHADSVLTAAHLHALRVAMRRGRFVGGAFHRGFDDRHPIMRHLEPLERWRCVHGRALFGDQSIFVRRDIFADLGGFEDIPLLEDFEFSRRLRSVGRLDILDPPMTTSARHHTARGAWRTSLRNLTYIVLFRAGVSPWRLHRWYYRGRPLGRITSQSGLPVE